MNSMNWMEKWAQLRGEWWIIDGQAQFADADTGELGHDAYVIQSIIAEHSDEIMEALGLNSQEDVFDYQLFDPTIVDKEKLHLLGFSDEEITGLKYPREYGMEKLGWKRVAGPNIETQTLSSADLKDIANGLYDAYDEEATNAEFNLEVRGTKSLYQAVPFAVIETEDPMRVREYGLKYASTRNWYKQAQEAQEWDLNCPECGGKLRLRSGDWGPYYSCENRCGVTHGAFKSGKPRGVPGDLETIALRKAAHEKFDQLWKMHSHIPNARTKAYEWLARKMNCPISECHMAKFNKEQLRRVIGISNWALEQYKKREEEKKTQLELDL